MEETTTQVPTEMAQVFEPILEKGEHVVRVFKPSKAKFGWFWGLSWFISWFWVPFISIGFLWNNNEWVGADSTFWLVFGITMGVFVLSGLLYLLLGWLWFRNRFYAYTDRRILIRAGIIGIDYKSLEYKSLTAKVVKVSLLDKMVRRNTGTINFGSAASPVLSIWSGHSNQFTFPHICKPYETLKEINEYMADKE
ncbi:MAG: PH domain-containing protein [Firmicutes bacterium]|nr:PH domain-containing protein [Bacillota bacterium]